MLLRPLLLPLRPLPRMHHKENSQQHLSQNL